MVIVSKNAEGPKAVQIKIELVGTEPSVWRRIQLLSNSSLSTLQYAICDVMEWKYLHPYKFVVAHDAYGNLELDFEFEGWADDSSIRVGSIASRHSESEFLYDLEAGWTHRVIIEDVFQADLNERYPLCVAGANAASPDGCGGIAGFKVYKKSVPLTKYEASDDLLDVIRLMSQQTRKFDPTFFSLAFVNEVKLSRRRKVAKRKSRDDRE